MAQHDYVLDNQTRTNFRQDLNAVLAAILSNNSGAAEPTVKVPYMWWPDTTTGKLKIRNAANTAWIIVGDLASVYLGLLSPAGGDLTGALNEKKGADIVAAATTDIFGATDGNIKDITHAAGTLAITGFGTAQAGAVREGRFIISGGALSITHNATSMILNAGGGNITLANGDRYEAVSLGAGNCFVKITKADGTAVVSSGGNKRSFSVHRNSTSQTSIANNTNIKVRWTTEIWDTGNNFEIDADDSGGATESRFTPTIAGKYLLIAVVAVSPLDAAGVADIMIYKNGVVYKSTRFTVTATPSSNIIPQIACIVDANGTTDYFEVYIYQNGGGSESIDGGIGNTYFMGSILS